VSSLDVRSIEVAELRKRPCPSTKHEFRIFVSEAAFDRAVARGDGDTTREIGGVLVGELLRDDAGPYLLIDATIDALHAEEKGAELTFTHATWEHIHKEMDARHQDKRVVGWYHTHPGFGVFLSDRDQFIHKSFFNLPFQVAFVYDPKSHEHGMFAWHDNEVWRARRYWIGAREQVWDGPRVAVDKLARERAEPDARRAAATNGPGEAEARGTARDEIGSPGPVAMLIAVGVVVALLGGVVGHWLGVGSANQALTEAQLAIAGAKADGAKAGVAMLQADLLGILRDTYSDEAMHRPVAEAVAVIDQMLAALPPDAVALGPVAADPAAGSPDPRWASFAQQLKAARMRMFQLEQARGTARSELAVLEAAARRGNELPKEVAREFAEQRSGLGAIYAELAADAARTGDPGRARRLLTAAAHLDPGNRTRYEKQLQAFDPKGHLPPDSSRVDSSGEGAPR
jgi:proteasome lid subunit RPN8/RPN11